MASLLSESEKISLRETFNDIFDSWSRPLIIYKEPIKTAASVDPSNFIYGFGESQAQDNFTYTEITGVYPVTAKYGDQVIDQNTDINAFISAGSVTVKIREDGRSFINSGKTEKFILDSRTFFLDGDELKQTFLPSGFYLFKLKATK